MTIFEELAGQPTDAQITARLQALQSWLSVRLSELDVQDPVLISVWLGPLAEQLVRQDLLLASVEQYGQLSANLIGGLTDDQQLRLRNALASSLGVSEIPASRAVGELQIVLRNEQSLSLPANTLFNYGSIQYRLTEPAVLRSVENRTNSTAERLLTRQLDGTWQATVPVVAVTSGQSANIAEGSALTLATPLTNVINVLASVAFVGGRDANALQDLIDAVFNRTAHRTMGTRDQIVAFLQTRTELGLVRQCGVIGFGDREMHRDKLFGFPLGGGCADVYLASAEYPTTHQVVLTSRVTAVGAQAIYRVGIDRDVSPGYLLLVDATDDLTGAPLTVTAEQRGFDLTPILGEQIPRLTTSGQAAFSRFQTASLTATGPLPTGVSGTVDRLIRLRFRRVPGIAIAQTLACSRTSGYLAGDTLIRSAVPIFLQVRIQLATTFDAEIGNPDPMRSAVVETIMRRPMRSRLHAHDITAAIARYLPDDVSVVRVDFEGLLVKPDGSTQKLTGVELFEVPNLPDEQLTPRTVAIYIVPSAVKITAEQYIAYETP